MSVYPRKNSKGEYTGKWTAEVMRKGVEYKQDFDTQAAAKAWETEVKLGRVVTLKAEDTRYTVGQLQRDARVVWAKQKDHKQSHQRYDLCCELLGLSTPIETIDYAMLEKLIETLRERSLSDSTVHRYLCTVSKALKWAQKKGHIIGRPLFPWEELEKGEERDAIVPPEDDARLLEWTKTKGSPDIGIVMETLLLTGMRVNELRKLQPDDFDKASQMVTIGNWDGKTKNGTKRKVHLPADVMEKALALATVGWPSYRRINTAFHNAHKDLGLKYAFTPHVMRHTVATRLAEEEVPVSTIMDMLGHKSPATTKRYTHTTTKALTNAANKLHRPKTEDDEAA